MVVAKQLISPQTIASTATTYLTGPSLIRTLVKKVTVTNPGLVALTVTAYIVPAAAVAGVTNIIVDQKTIAAHETKELFELENQVIETDQRLQMLASTGGALVVCASGVEMTN